MEENKADTSSLTKKSENLHEDATQKRGSETKIAIEESDYREKEQEITQEPIEKQEASLFKAEDVILETDQQLVEQDEGGQQIEIDQQQEIDDPQEQELENEQHEEINPHLLVQDNLLNLVNSISSANLLSEESIMALKELLCPSNPKLDAINLKEPKIDEYILMSIIKDKSISAHNALGDTLNYYNKMLMDSQIHHLDKFIRIIKSKKREMHLRSIRTNSDKIMYFGEGLEHTEAQLSSNEPLKGIQESKGNQDISGTERISDNPIDIIDLLEHNQLDTMILNKKVLPRYNRNDKSICFTVNNKYEVKLKICDEITILQKSKIDRIPAHIIQSNIFPFLTSSELFSMRAVNNEWRDLVRGTWHIVFKREMLDQIVAADLCNDIELHFKLMQIRAPFYQKFGVFMNAIIEMVDWGALEALLSESQSLEKQEKLVIITLVKFLGYKVNLEKLWDYQESDWEYVTGIISSELKEKMYSVLDKEFIFDSNIELERFKKNFIDAPDISISQLKALENKSFLMLSLFMRQMLVFGMLRNHLAISQKYVLIAKERLKEISRGWSSKKGFLEDAYKILLFRYVKIVNGQIIVSKDEDEEGKEEINYPSKQQNLQSPGNIAKSKETQKVLAKTEVPFCSNKIETGTISTQTEGIALPQTQEGVILAHDEDDLTSNPFDHKILRQSKDQDLIPTSKEDLDSSVYTKELSDSKNESEKEMNLIVGTNETLTKRISEERLSENFSKMKEEAINHLGESQKEQVGEEDAHQNNQINEIQDIMNENRITADRLLALSNLIGEFDEVKDFYSEDLETSIDRLIKWFLEKSKEKQNQIIPVPDYVIVKHGTETRVFLDNDTRLEMIIQKYLKLHILMMSLKAHIHEKPSEPEQQ